MWCRKDRDFSVFYCDETKEICARVFICQESELGRRKSERQVLLTRLPFPVPIVIRLPLTVRNFPQKAYIRNPRL